MQKGFSALCSSCFFFFITAILANIIILSIIKNNENTNSACGYFTFHLLVLLLYVTQETQTRLTVLVCGVFISVFHVVYKVCLYKDVNILFLCDINSFE